MVTRVVATAFGGPESLAVVEEDLGRPGPGQAWVEVRAVGTNPVDYKIYSGSYGGADESALPMPIGFEAAGVVVAVGDRAEGPAGPIAVGDEVIAFRISGAYASEVVVDASTLVPKPAAMSFEQASGLMLAGATAVHALAATSVGRGDTVVVHGASGGVGLMVVQLAVAAGATVVGTAGGSRHGELQRLGAKPVAYGDGVVGRVRAAAPGGVDAAIDCVGTDEAVDASLELVADRDRIATIAAFARAHDAGIKALGGGPGADPGTEIRNRARLELVRAVAGGSLEVKVARTYPLREAAAAHRELMTGHTHGKIVLLP
jgi:NADPH2:quinone reductase